MEKFTVGGMSCAACASKVEKAVGKVDGVTSCSVNLLTGDMIVDGSADSGEVISAVTSAGYTAAIKGKIKSVPSHKDDDRSSHEHRTTIVRLIASSVLLLILMYVSMGHAMLKLPLPAFLSKSYTSLGLLQLILSGLVMVINQKFFTSGFKAVLNKSANMDTLVALGSGAAFVYSTYVLFMITGAEAAGKHEMASHLAHELYFESAAMILTLITVGKLLESHAKGRTTDALRSLMSLAPTSAVVLKDGEEVTLPVESIVKGDVIVVRPGGRFPVDAVIIEGACAVDESSLTGESIPVDKSVGDSVSASTVNTSGFVKCRATRVGEDTTFSQIIRLVSDASATKAPIARIADKVSGVFVPAVILISLITAAVWLLLGESADFILRRAISVLVISCPCALGLATPVAIMVGSGVGAKNGILFKNATALEGAGKCSVVVLDKTGTVTRGTPSVSDVIPLSDADREALLALACSLEAQSEHPLAKAIVEKAKETGLPPFSITDFKAEIGCGVTGTINGVTAAGGKLDYIKGFCEVTKDALEIAEALAEDGKTPLYFALGGTLLGIIAVSDEVKPDSASAIAEMKQMGLKVVMLTGDNARTAAAVGRIAGVEEVISDVLPTEKASFIEKMKKEGRVMMVGDGTNDAPALVCADTGVAIGAGVDVAVDSADVVLIKSRLTDVVSAIRLSSRTLKNIKENLFWAFIYNVVGIPLAAGLFVKSFGLDLDPMLASAAMSLSSFCVVTNALRLNFTKLGFDFNTENDKKTNTETEETNMTKTVKIEGMMCPHCEAHVKAALEKLDGVTLVVASHKDATAVITAEKDIADDVIRGTVEGLGYKYLG